MALGGLIADMAFDSNAIIADLMQCGALRHCPIRQSGKT
jgi:hypothetical protein